MLWEYMELSASVGWNRCTWSHVPTPYDDIDHITQVVGSLSEVGTQHKAWHRTCILSYQRKFSPANEGTAVHRLSVGYAPLNSRAVTDMIFSAAAERALFALTINWHRKSWAWEHMGHWYAVQMSSGLGA